MTYLYSSKVFKLLIVGLFLGLLLYFYINSVKPKDRDLNPVYLASIHIYESLFFKYLMVLIHIWICRDFCDLILLGFPMLNYSFGIAQLWLYFVNTMLYITRHYWFDQSLEKKPPFNISLFSGPIFWLLVFFIIIHIVI